MDHYLSLPLLCSVSHLPYERVTDVLFLISNFRRYANVVFFLVGDSPGSEICADVSEHSVPSSYAV
jgi:hypothetical protein